MNFFFSALLGSPCGFCCVELFVWVGFLLLFKGASKIIFNCLPYLTVTFLGGVFKYFVIFHPYLGKIPILTNIFKWVETTN